MSRVPQPRGLQVRDVVRGTRHTLVLSGELDLLGSLKLEDALSELSSNGARGLVVDLSGVSFIDSRGLCALLTARKLAESRGYEFSLIQGPAEVRRVFEITNLLEVLPFVDGPA